LNGVFYQAALGSQNQLEAPFPSFHTQTIYVIGCGSAVLDEQGDLVEVKIDRFGLLCYRQPIDQSNQP